jgi:asparaginyl-tRNA synthetase
MVSRRIKEILSSEADGRSITVEGWVRTRRDSKGIRFLEINDGSTIKNLQVIIDESFEKYDEIGENVNKGASIRVTGNLVASEGKGQRVELSITGIEIIGTAPVEEYPLQKKRHSFEFLREIAHLRPRTNTFGAVARVRNAMSYAVHRYFQENGFVYVHTPVISGSDCEGAGEMFQVTTLIPDNAEKIPAEIDYSHDFFGKKAYLTVSGQLEGETYACALKNIYTFGPTFRAENSNTSRHLAEFWMVEPEMAFCDIDLNMDIAEDFLKFILRDLLEKCPDDMDFFNSRIEKGLIENIEQMLHETNISFFAISRPLLTEPQLIKRWKNNDRKPVKCVRCSRCRTSEGNYCTIFKR